MRGLQPSVVEQATIYLMKEWKRKGKAGTPPLELTTAVCQTVCVCGYTKKMVDELLTSWIARERAEAKGGTPA